MPDKSRTRSVGDRIRDLVLAAVALATLAHVMPAAWAAWDASKPANNSALVSSEIRANWAALESAIGNPDSATLQIKATNFTSTVNVTGVADFDSLPTGLGMLRFARSSADFIKNANTTLADVTGLSFSVAANENYAFQFHLRGKSSDTADWKITCTGPSSPTAVWFGVVSSNTNPGTGSVSAFGGTTTASGTGGVDQSLMVNGLLRNGANAGTVQLQAAQLASDATNTTIYQESYVVVWRVP